MSHAPHSQPQATAHGHARGPGAHIPSPSPLADLARLVAGAAPHEPHHGRLLSRSFLGSDPMFMDRLGEQFADALASNRLESAMAMLAACPQLALLPCRKALHSALHWSCASPNLAPAALALLALGCDPLGFASHPGGPSPGSATPLRWAASSGSYEALAALASAGAVPNLGDLREACRGAHGRCAMVILGTDRLMDPFASGVGVEHDIDTGSVDTPSCYTILTEAIAALSNPLNAWRIDSHEALAAFEARGLELALGRSDSASQGSGKRL